MSKKKKKTIKIDNFELKRGYNDFLWKLEMRRRNEKALDEEMKRKYKEMYGKEFEDELPF